MLQVVGTPGASVVVCGLEVIDYLVTLFAHANVVVITRGGKESKAAFNGSGPIRTASSSVGNFFSFKRDF